MQLEFGQIFEKPATPAAQVLCHVRKHPLIGRGDLVKATGLSQPTITRAVTALADAGLLRERRDLINTSRPGRPVVPLELDTWQGLLIGVALDGDDAVVGCYDSKGRLLREIVVSEFAKDHICADTLEYIIAAIYRIKGDMRVPLKAIALGASSIHWNDFTAIAKRLEFEFKVPAIAANAAASIALAEIQQDPSQEDVFVLFSENVTSGAFITTNGVSVAPNQLSVEEWLDYIIELRPKQIVFSGAYFTDTDNRNRIRAQLNDAFQGTVILRMLRPELETMRTITHALALAEINARPLELARS